LNILLDSCVWGKADVQLVAAGHDVVAIKDWPRDPGDEEVLRFGIREQRAVMTLVRDFGELAVFRRFRHFGIIRLVDIPAKSHASAILSVILAHAELLARGGIVTVEPGRVRLREPQE